jgi:exonuclease VII large subunit
MAYTVLSLGEWLFKQQQQLQQQLGKLTEKQQLIEEQQQEIEQLKEALDIAFLRKMRYGVREFDRLQGAIDTRGIFNRLQSLNPIDTKGIFGR